MAKNKDVGNSANNTGLKWGITDDQQSIRNLRDLGKAFKPPKDVKNTLRWLCENMTSFAKKKVREMNKLLKAV